MHTAGSLQGKLEEERSKIQVVTKAADRAVQKKPTRPLHIIQGPPTWFQDVKGVFLNGGVLGFLGALDFFFEQLMGVSNNQGPQYRLQLVGLLF